MKKALFTLAMVLMGTIAHAQSIDKFISQFEGNNDAQVIRMDKNMIKKELADDSNDEDKDAIRIIKHIDSVRVLDLEECSADVKAEFYNETKNFNAKGYDELISTIEDGDKTLILTKGKGDTITELLILETGKEDCELVQIKGKITQAEIDQIIKEHQKDK